MRQHGAILVVLLLAPAVAAAQVTIAGSSLRLTTDPHTHFGPSISGNIVAYTVMGTVPGSLAANEVFYYDLSTNLQHQVTAATLVSEQVAGDVSGNTIVYTEVGATSTVKAFTIGGTTRTLASPAANPGIDGTLVAWEDYTSGTSEIWAMDLSGGTAKQITNGPGQNSLHPNVSGRNIVYSTETGSTCQVFVTNFDSLHTTQLTSSATGCNGSPDISGSRVVYQADRDGNQDIYVFDMGTSTETRVVLAGLQQNPHVSGDWVAFEDLNPTSVSSIRLYHVPSGTVLTAVQATTGLQSATLNDIDGTRVVYNSSAAGDLDIYLFQFTVESTLATDCAHLNGAVPVYTGTFTRRHRQDDFVATFGAVAGPGLACVASNSSCIDAHVEVDGVRVRSHHRAGRHRGPGQAFVTLTASGNTVRVDADGREGCSIRLDVYEASGVPPTDCPRPTSCPEDGAPPVSGCGDGKGDGAGASTPQNRPST